MFSLLGVFFSILCYVGSSNIPHVGPEFLNMLREAGRHEEFAKYLGIDDVSLVLPGEGRTEEEMKFTTVSPLGDILLDPEDEEEDRQGINFGRYPGSRWPNNRIPYSIATSDFSQSNIDRIKTAISQFNARSNKVKIVERRNENDYVMVISGNGCYARLGKAGGQQVLSVNRNGCLRIGTIQHEFLHAAGMMHEQSHQNRDNYVKILWENIPENWRSQYEKLNSRDYSVYGPYDYYSVMHYGMNAPETGRPAFEFYDNSVNTRRVGQREGPSDTDIRKLNALYN